MIKIRVIQPQDKYWGWIMGFDTKNKVSKIKMITSRKEKWYFKGSNAQVEILEYLPNKKMFLKDFIKWSKGHNYQLKLSGCGSFRKLIEELVAKTSTPHIWINDGYQMNLFNRKEVK